MPDYKEERTRLDIRVVDINDRRIFKDNDSDAYMPLDVNYNSFWDLLNPDSPTFDMYNEIDFASSDQTMDRTVFSDQ